ncbi:MAG: M56 family metallopeptidase [Acidobacteriota bacterium]
MIDPLSLLVKSTAVWALAVAVLWAMRGRAASTRHLLWTTSFLALLALPALVWALPPLDLSLAFGTGAMTASPIAAGAAPWLWGLWATGAALALVSLTVGGWRFAAWARGGTQLDDAAWRSTVDALRGELGIRRRVRLVLCPQVSVPMVGGVAKPVVLLPPGAVAWGERRRRAVLSHELVHVCRHDALRQLLAGAAVALYWFHPLAWLAARAAGLTREQACDEGVLDLGLRPSVYAGQLLALAGAETPATPALSLPLVERSHLERRITQILRADRPLPRRLQAAFVAALLLFGAVTAATAVPAVPKPVCTYENPIPN